MDDKGGLWARGRKLLHWATGDRSSEAEALQDEARRRGADVSPAAAEHEVQRAHGDLGIGTKGVAEPDVPDPRSADQE